MATTATGLVYTEVRGDTDPMKEVLRVKQSLAARAQSVAPMQAGAPVDRTVYTNGRGRSLLESFQMSFQDMQNNILTLRKQVEDQEEKHAKSIKALCEQVETQREEHAKSTKVFTDELLMLSPLKDTALGIRKRFFATYRRGEDEMEVDDPAIIEFGNLKAHRGNVRLDVYLFNSKLIEHEETFIALYGFSLEKAKLLLKSERMVSVMNKRASGLANANSNLKPEQRPQWTPAQEVAFRELVVLINKATVAELEEKFGGETDTGNNPPPPNA